MSLYSQIPDSFRARALSIAVVSPDEERRNAAILAVGECQSGPVDEFLAYSQGGDDWRQMRRRYDVVLIDLDSDSEQAIEMVDKICATGLTTVMVYSARADQELVVRCMRAGAREYLAWPIDCGEMALALVRAAALSSSSQRLKENKGKLLVFLGSKGGAGVTTVACNVAVSLAREYQQRTLLIDLNLPLGDAAILLGVKAQYSIASVFQNVSRLDSHLLSSMLTRHSSGLSVLAAPDDFTPTYISTGAIERLIEVALQDFEYVVVDAGTRLDMQSKDIFDESATIYLVTQAGIPELRNSRRVISMLSAKGGPKLEIILNRYDQRHRDIAEEYIAKSLTRPADWKIPNNYAAVRRMQNTAIPLAGSGSQIAHAMQQLTSSVCGKPVFRHDEEEGKWPRLLRRTRPSFAPQAG